MAAFRQFILEPIQKQSATLFILQMAQMINDRTGGRYDALMIKALSILKPKVSLPSSQLMDERAIAASVSTLRERGWDLLPWRLGADDIAELRRFAFSTPAYAKNPNERISITESSIPSAHGRYVWRISDLIRSPVVQRLMSDSALHRIAQEYIGCRPILTSVAMWLDPFFDGVYGAHAYHYDNDGPAFLKFFIYLNDVDAENGAHNYIQRSHKHFKPKQFSRAGFQERSDLLDFYGAENEMIFTGPAGMVLAEDTAGFHKGTTLKKGYRLLLQLQYAALDIPHEEELLRDVQKLELTSLDPGIRRIARKFFT